MRFSFSGPAFAAALLLAVFGASGPGTAQELDTQSVNFGGYTGTIIDGVITGREADLYQLNGTAGDVLTVRMQQLDGNSAHFNVYAPGRGPGDDALANSSMISASVPDINEFSSALPQTGTYTVAVYNNRAQARDGVTATYAIEFDLLAQTTPQNADGEPLFFQVRTRSANGNLNLHIGPSEDSPRIGRYSNGTILRDIGGCRDAGGREWCEVMAEQGGLAGYVARDFLAPVSRSAPTRTQPATPLPVRADTPGAPYYYVHLSSPSGHLNVHATPSTAGIIVGRLPDGANLRNIGGCVFREGHQWCDVMQAGGGVSGWVAGEFLRDGHAPAAHVTGSPVAPATAPPPASDFADGLMGGPDWWQVSTNRRGSALRVHTHPSTSSPVFARFPNGTILRNADGCRMVEGDRWCFVTSVSGHVEGWVAGDFLIEGSAPGVASSTPTPPPAMAPVPEQPILEGPDYDGTGEIACVANMDAADQMCSYGTVHEGSGNGFLQITQDGFGMRTIFFEGGVPVYFDQSQADGDAEMRTNLDGENWVVFVGDARFVIPAALFGGTGGGMATQLPLAPPEMPAESGGGDALVPGTEFNATAPITCTPGMDAADTTCEAGVVRNGDGSGYISVTLPDGRMRAVFFENNVPVGFDQAEADGDIEMTVQQDGDMFTVFIGDLRLVFPLALMAGG